MKTQGKHTNNTRLVGMANAMPRGKITMVEQVECIGIMTTDNAFLCFHAHTDPKTPNRPYLHFIGKCKEIRADLPFNISAITFGEREEIGVDFFYEFDNKQLSELALKGLFEKEFKVPTLLRMNQTGIEVPILCNFKVVHPEQEGDVPIVFAEIIDSHNIEMDMDSSGYRMSDYFEAVVVTSEVDEELDYLEETMTQAHTLRFDEMYEPQKLQEDTMLSKPLQEELSEEEQYLRNTYDEIEKKIDEFEKKQKEELVEEKKENEVAVKTKQTVKLHQETLSDETPTFTFVPEEQHDEHEYL